MINNEFDFSCVLFDLDGTLLNTAPDLSTALNKALAHFNFPEVSASTITPYISYGAAVMIDKALKQDIAAELKADILQFLLDYYAHHIAVDTELYAGMPQLLETLEINDIPWGVVTNKRKQLTHPLMQALGLAQRAVCIICGDTTAYSKPHPEPMLAACRRAQVAPDECLYIGDAQHDITAGKAANMKTLAATYGYLKPDDKPQDWGADGLIHHPDEIIDWITTQTHAFN